MYKDSLLNSYHDKLFRVHIIVHISVIYIYILFNNFLSNLCTHIHTMILLLLKLLLYLYCTIIVWYRTRICYLFPFITICRELINAITVYQLQCFVETNSYLAHVRFTRFLKKSKTIYFYKKIIYIKLFIYICKKIIYTSIVYIEIIFGFTSFCTHIIWHLLFNTC